MGANGEVHERDEEASRVWSDGRRQNSMDSEGMNSRAASSCSSRACGCCRLRCVLERGVARSQACWQKSVVRRDQAEAVGGSSCGAQFEKLMWQCERNLSAEDEEAGWSAASWKWSLALEREPRVGKDMLLANQEVVEARP